MGGLKSLKLGAGVCNVCKGQCFNLAPLKYRVAVEVRVAQFERLQKPRYVLLLPFSTGQCCNIQFFPCLVALRSHVTPCTSLSQSCCFWLSSGTWAPKELPHCKDLGFCFSQQLSWMEFRSFLWGCLVGTRAAWCRKWPHQKSWACHRVCRGKGQPCCASWHVWDQALNE